MSELNIKSSLLLGEAMQFRHAARVAEEGDEETYWRLAVIDSGGPLCEVYADMDGCHDCPVKVAIGKDNCRGTPMRDAGGDVDAEQCYKAAEYLEKLAGEMG